MSGSGRGRHRAAIEEAVEVRRGIAEARPDAFLPDLAGSLHNLSNRLSDLGRREDALAAIEEAMHLVLPKLERTPWVLADAGLSLVQRYLALQEAAEQEPADDLLERMYAVLVSAGVVSENDEPE